VCVSEELADGVVHDAAPIDVVGVHRRVLQGTQDVETCVCVLEGADDEVIDGVPSDEAVELLLSIHLLECTCVCHVFVCFCAHVSVFRGNHPLRFRQRIGRSHPEERRSEQRPPCPSEMGHRRSPSMSV